MKNFNRKIIYYSGALLAFFFTKLPLFTNKTLAQIAPGPAPLYGAPNPNFPELEWFEYFLFPFLSAVFIFVILPIILITGIILYIKKKRS